MILDTVIDPREVWITEAWVRVREWIEQTEDLSVGELVRMICLEDLSEGGMKGCGPPAWSPMR